VPTELLLTSSDKTGEDLQLCFDRQYLSRAAEMGLSRFRFYGQDSVVLATDPQRSYVWMPTAKQGIVPAVANSLRVESPSIVAGPRPTLPSRRTASMKRTPTSAATTISQGITSPTTAPSPSRRRQRIEPSAPANAIEQAIHLQTQLREQLQAVKELIRKLKAEKKQQRLLKSTLASLRELQQVA
jgi:hypothetical protein